MKTEAAQPDVLPVEQDRHFVPKQIAQALGISVWTARRLLTDVDGVVRRRRGGRVYMSVPARVWAGLHRKLTEKLI